MLRTFFLKLPTCSWEDFPSLPVCIHVGKFSLPVPGRCHKRGTHNSERGFNPFPTGMSESVWVQFANILDFAFEVCKVGSEPIEVYRWGGKSCYSILANNKANRQVIVKKEWKGIRKMQ